MLEGVFVVGFLFIGVEVMCLGVIFISGVFYLIKVMDVEVGVMIFVFYNLVQDNGIKFFGGDGFKFFDEQEVEIECLMDELEDRLLRLVGVDFGFVNDYFEGG